MSVEVEGLRHVGDPLERCRARSTSSRAFSGLDRVVLIGDRGRITMARVNETVKQTA